MNLKIGYILGSFPKLSESFIMNEVIALINLGVEAKIFSLSKVSEEIMHGEVEEYNLRERTSYHLERPLSKREKISCVLMNPVCFSRVISSPLSLRRKIRLFPYLIEISNRAKALGLDLLHAHFATRPTIVALHLSKILRIPYTFTAHAVDIFSKPNFRLLRTLSLDAAYVITPSLYNKNYLNNVAGVNPDKIRVVRACANINKYRRIPKINRQRNIILTGCRLVKKKGIHFLIVALKKLVPRYPHLSLKIFGTGEEEKELRALVSQLSLGKHVYFLGDVPDTELLKLYNEAWMYVLPCIVAPDGDRDVCPLTLQEAMACQTPVISTNIASVPELIESGREGILVEQKNVEQLENTIDILLKTDEGELRKMGRASRRKVEREFDPFKNAKILLRIFNSAVC